MLDYICQTAPFQAKLVLASAHWQASADSPVLLTLPVLMPYFYPSASSADMSDVVPPEVRPKPAVPAKPPNVGAPSPSNPFPTQGPGIGVGGSAPPLPPSGIPVPIGGHGPMHVSSHSAAHGVGHGVGHGPATLEVSPQPIMGVTVALTAPAVDPPCWATLELTRSSSR